MATRGTTSQERAEATTVELLTSPALDEDVEQAFEDWRGSFDKNEEPGKVTAYEIPLDERNNPNYAAKTQIRIGSWPIDVFTFDELCDKIIRECMVPENRRQMCVRYAGTKAGERGLRFNKVVMLRALAQHFQERQNVQSQESTSTLLKAFQEMSERTVAMLQQMRPVSAPPDATAELTRMLSVAKMMNEPLNNLMALLVPALIGRSAQGNGSDTAETLTAMLDGAAKIAELARGGGENGPDDSVAGIIRAIAPLAKPALEAIPHITAAAAAAAGRPGAPALPNPAAPAPQPDTLPPNSAPSRASVADIPSGDMAMFAQLKPQIDSLVQMAAQGSDPTGAADMLFDGVMVELDDDTYSRVADMLSRPAIVDQVAIFNPEAAKYRVFFEKFRAQIAKRVAQEDANLVSAPTVTPAAPLP